MGAAGSNPELLATLLSRPLLRRLPGHAEKLVKKGSIVHHRVPQVLRAGLILLVTHSNGVSGSIVLHHARIVHTKPIDQGP